MTDDLNIYDLLVAQEKLRRAEFAFLNGQFTRIISGVSMSDETIRNLQIARAEVDELLG